MELQLSDNMKARIIDGEQSNKYKREGSDILNRSQIEAYYHIKRKMEALANDANKVEIQ